MAGTACTECGVARSGVRRRISDIPAILAHARTGARGSQRGSLPVQIGAKHLADNTMGCGVAGMLDNGAFAASPTPRSFSFRDGHCALSTWERIFASLGIHAVTGSISRLRSPLRRPPSRGSARTTQKISTPCPDYFTLSSHSSNVVIARTRFARRRQLARATGAAHYGDDAVMSVEYRRGWCYFPTNTSSLLLIARVVNVSRTGSRVWRTDVTDEHMKWRVLVESRQDTAARRREQQVGRSRRSNGGNSSASSRRRYWHWHMVSGRHA